MFTSVLDQIPAALVYGGSRGIGAAVATRLAADGFRVALTYVSRPDKAEEVVASIRGKGGTAMALQADSADAAAIRAAAGTAAETYGPLAVAVVNAGVLRLASLQDLALDDLDRMLSVNIRGVVLALQASAAVMWDGGRLITIGSNSAIRTGSAIGATYAMTKAAVAALVRGVALDLAPRRITVNNVQPGPTETDMTADMVSQLRDAIPLRRLVQPSEVAGMVSYLAGPEAAAITGASLTMDGGFVL
jgi:3-oxoacyl-[acyl-carrier protein] reductase